ncbi:MAG: hypothetical protein WBE72_21125 [Terracidiphilus sp.]
MVKLLRFVVFTACFLSAGVAFAQGGACPTVASYLSLTTGSLVTLSSLGVTSCFYFSKSTGSDSNAGTSETSPQAHLPGMPSYTGKITPTAGEGFILKGGDTWVASDLDLYWQWTGSSGSPIYIGVDPGWPASGWTRPVFTCGGSACSYTANGNGFYTDQSNIQYIMVDNLEMTGLQEQCSGVNPNYFSVYGSNNTFEHIYAHGWSHATQACGATDGSAVFAPSTCCGGGLNNTFFYNVIDGSDTTEDMMQGFLSPPIVYDNVISYVTDGILGASNDIHSNYIGPIVLCYTSGGCHQNNLQNSGPASGNYIMIYDNIITGSPAGGASKLWIAQGTNTSSLVSYVFNNLLFNNVTGNDVNICQIGSACGTHNIFNNTFECDTGACSAPTVGETMTVNWINNHCISSASNCINQPGAPVTVNITTSLNETVSVANGQGYTQTGTGYAWQPTSTSTATLAKGTNEQSLCTTIGNINTTAGIACQHETNYSCTYNTANHTVSCPNLIPTARPPAWDIGSYQVSPVPAPTGIGDTVSSPN